jgi:hypothetical protein
VTSDLPLGEPLIPASHVPVDEIGRPVITDAQKQQVTDVLKLVDPDAKAALLIFADMQEARANLAWKARNGWVVAAGAGFAWGGTKPSGFVSIGKVWR